MHKASPADPERYYLRVLLNHKRGPTSFEDLKTVVVNGVPTVCDTFREAADKLGLLDRDDASRQCMLEASSVCMPDALIKLFGTLLVFCNPIDSSALWNEFSEFMTQKYPALNNSVHAVNSVLSELESSLAEHGKKLSDYDLPRLPHDYIDPNQLPKEIIEEMSIQIPSEDLRLHENLNPDQHLAFTVILSAGADRSGYGQRVFFY
ncbi:DNA helicase [Ranunculus cassubicifolius]